MQKQHLYHHWTYVDHIYVCTSSPDVVGCKSPNRTHKISIWFARTAIRRGQSVKYLIQDSVLDYIIKHNLYTRSTHASVTSPCGILSSVSCNAVGSGNVNAAIVDKWVRLISLGRLLSFGSYACYNVISLNITIFFLRI